VFVEQSHLAGAEAEVDFGEAAVRLRGELVKCPLFCLRLSFSGKAVHRVFASGGQEAFYWGHEHAFRVLGGVPFGKIRYDGAADVRRFRRRGRLGGSVRRAIRALVRMPWRGLLDHGRRSHADGRRTGYRKSA